MSPLRGLGARSVTSVALALAAAIALVHEGMVRGDYWAQLSPWVPFLVGGFAVLAGTLAFGFWRLGERSEYYFRFGERLPFGGETALGPAGGRGRTLLVGHAPQVEAIDFPPLVQRLLYVAIASCIGLVTVTNRAVALLREVPERFDSPSADYCPPPAAPKPPDTAVPPGCKLVLRAYKLGYTKQLGTCAPRAAIEDDQPAAVCTKRQLDEPYLHYAWRLLETRPRELIASPEARDGFADQLAYLGDLVDATADAIAMQPRSSHHLFTDRADPRGGWVARARAAVTQLGGGACGARLAHLAHFPAIDDPSALLEHVLAQLMFNPAYQPSVAECREVIVHWGAPADTCARLAAAPADVLAEHDALDAVTEVLAARRTQAELERHRVRRRPGELAAPQRIVSFQCLMTGEPTASPIEHDAIVGGERFRVREMRGAAGADQIGLYKQLAELLADGFGYGRLTSNQAVGARPDEATLAAQFREPAFLLTKLELLRDADLFLGNDWLGKRPDLLAAYPYHLHLKSFVEIFRRQYRLHRGRL